MLQLVAVLGLKYEVNLLDDDNVEKILRPLLGAKEVDFAALKSSDVTMSLQCLVTLLKLSAFIKYNLSLSIMDERNIQSLVGLALKYGDKGKLRSFTKQEEILKIIFLRQSNAY